MSTLFGFDQSINIKAARSRVFRSWESCASKGIENATVRVILPAVKLHEMKTHPPWDSCHSPGLVVKLEDLITESGKKTKPIFHAVERAGGLHWFLDYDGKIVLSSIMSDKAISGLSLDMHAEIINATAPDYYITPDGETYIDERPLAAYEIRRMLGWTEYLLDHCSEPKPIGLVKGACLAQVESHTERLKDIGFNMFAFHAGDFIFRSSKKSINLAKTFYSAIRKKVPWLMIYGVGSDRYFRAFQRADCFATQSHFISAFRGREIGDTGMVPVSDPCSKSLIIRNIRAMESYLIRLEAENAAALSGTSKEGI